MSFILVALACVIFVYMYVSLKGTLLHVSVLSGRLWGLILYRDCFFVLFPVVLIQGYGVESFPLALFNVSDQDVSFIGLMIVLSMMMFILFVTVLSRLFYVNDKISSIAAYQCGTVRSFSNSAIAVSVMMLLFSIFFLEYKHSFFESLVNDEALLKVRLENAYKSSLPSQFSHVFILVSWIASIQCGIELFFKKRFAFFSYFVIALILSTAKGDKAPLLISILIIIMSYFSLKKPKFNLIKTFAVMLTYFFVLTTILYFIVLLQAPDIGVEGFLSYFINRVGLGNIAGVYETFSISPLSGDFYYHMIPFASIFIDYEIYAKELMVHVENIEYLRTGVKNSFFISEAYGVGGWCLVILSPFIVSFNFAMGIWVFYKFMTFFYGFHVANIFSLPIFLLSFNITGGFSSFFLFKGVLLLILLMFVFFPVSLFLNCSFVARESRVGLS